MKWTLPFFLKTHSRFVKKAVLCVGLFAGIAISSNRPAFADPIPTCAAGTIADILNTTCTIGDLTFTFTGFTGSYGTSRPPCCLNFVVWDPQDFTFTPVNNGFTLAVEGPQSAVSPPSPDHAFNSALLTYTVSVPKGLSLAGETVSSEGVLSISGLPPQPLPPNDAHATAGYAGFTDIPSTQCYTDIRTDPLRAFFGGSNCGLSSGRVIAALSVPVFDIDGPIFDSGNVSYATGYQFGVGEGRAYPLSLHANRDGLTASIDNPATTFTYQIKAVPEPSGIGIVIVGLGVGSIGLFARRRNFLQSEKSSPSERSAGLQH